MTSQAPSQMVATIAANVRKARTDSGLTQRQLAHAVGTDAALVSKWERGLHRPADHNLAAIADATDREHGWFYADHAKAAA